MAKRTKQIRVDDDVAEMAEVLAPLMKKSVPELLSDLLRPILKKDLARALDRRRKELDQPPQAE